VAYDKFRHIKDWSELFEKVLLDEKDLTKTNYKINETIRKHIKYEFCKNDNEVNQGELPRYGLFSHDRIMCHTFVFDYNNESSFREVLSLATLIRDNEGQNAEGLSFISTIKIFLANKYPQFVLDETKENTEDMPPDEIKRRNQEKDNFMNDFFSIDNKAKYYRDELNKFFKIKRGK
jgi:hypothetical protein